MTPPNEDPPAVTGPGIYPDIPEDRYHADDTLSPELGRSLSSSGVRKLLACPARFEYELSHPAPPSDTFDFGHAAHRLVLGAGNDIARIDADDWRLVATRNLRDTAREQGKVPMLKGDYDRAVELAGAVTAHPVAAEIFATGQPEVSLYWIDETTGVTCRARIDWVTSVALVDLKTTQDANDGFARSAANFGYYQQAEWYRRGYRAVTGDDLPFVFVAVEKTPPYPLRVWAAGDEVALDRAAERNDRALALFAQCESTGVWPSYPETIDDLILPRWAS